MRWRHLTRGLFSAQEFAMPQFQHQENPEDIAVECLVDIFILRPEPFGNTFAKIASLLESRTAKDV